MHIDYFKDFGPELYENRVRHWAQQMGFPFGPSVYMLI